MDRIDEIITQLIDLYNSSKSNLEKHTEGSKLWTEYYKLCCLNNIERQDGYNLYLMLENESYIINEKPIIKDIDPDKLETAVSNLEKAVSNTIMTDGISLEDAKTILDWTVNNTRNNLGIMGINLNNNSLNGFCEISQALSLMPLEKIGLKVTKNTAKDAFSYPFNHCFGTVTFPIYDNGKVIDKTFLIDVTYRQFFSTVRCNEGRYYTKEENTKLDTAPDPGYFVDDEYFAKELMANGYIELNDMTAEKYGKPFVMSSKTKNMSKDIETQDYFNLIMSTSSNYKAHSFDIEGLNVAIPRNKTTNIKHNI